MLTYADAMLCAGEDELSRMREAQVSAMAHFVALSAPADVCSRMLTYAHVCSHTGVTQVSAMAHFVAISAPAPPSFQVTHPV